ncbi:MAG: sulfite exporter TauE/SafE family protein [Hyphomonadaceae bacterium]|nr:sulfite exporter TauE/SafE family protein [Hyphomonadaceae bacterium]
MSPEIIWFAVGLIAAGLLAGFAGGLFGIGGGIVIVPPLYWLMTALGVDEAVRMHVAVGTSLSTIITTSWRSLATHTKAGAVDFEVLKSWAPWISIGAIAGAVVAGTVSAEVLLIVFGGGLLLVALQMGFGNPAWRVASELPTGALRAVIAGAIGLLSALMGIGGGAFGVTVMTLCGKPIHRAVATASGFGAAIALPAAVGYAIAGFGREGLPPWSLGFVSLPGFVILGALTAITAPMGARLAHRLPQATLKRAFAVLLAVVAINMLREALA